MEKLKIMIVDDEAPALSALQRVVQEVCPDSNIHIFTKSTEALKFAQENLIDVAFLDIEMPVHNGIQLGKHLKQIDSSINIVFVTGYMKYLQSALDVRFSGYVQKPATAKNIKLEIENLRNPMPKKARHSLIRAQCFGNFEVFCNDKPIEFERKKTKELLAFLIDRKGITVNSNAVCARLWENNLNENNNRSNFRNRIADLKNTLALLSADAVFIKGFNKFSINPDLIECDYYDWLKNEPYAVRAFRGEYMAQYSWAEETVGLLFQDLK